MKLSLLPITACGKFTYPEEGNYKVFPIDSRGALRLMDERSTQTLPEGRCQLRFEFEPTGKPDIAKGKDTPGDARLYINRELVGQAALAVTIPLTIGIGGGLAVAGTPAHRSHASIRHLSLLPAPSTKSPSTFPGR